MMLFGYSNITSVCSNTDATEWAPRKRGLFL